MARKKAADAESVREAFESGSVELVGTWEAAEIIGVERPRIGRWLNRWREWRFGDEVWIKTSGRSGVPPHELAGPEDWTAGPEPDTKIPKPIANLKAGPVWLRSEIEEFAASRNGRREAAVR